MNIYEVIQLAKKHHIQHPEFLKEAALHFHDKAAVLKMIKEVGFQLYFMSDELKRDKEVVLASVKRDGSTLMQAAPEFLQDKEVVMAALNTLPSYNTNIVEALSEDMRNDPDIALLAISKNIYSIKHLSEKYRGDKALVYKNCAFAYPFLTEELQRDREIALKAVSGLGKNLEFAPNEYQDDEEIVLAAVKCQGESLKFASERLRSQPEIVKKAVRNEWSAIYFASDSAKNNADVMGYALKKDPHYFSLASDSLKNDKRFILNVIKLDFGAIIYASKEIQDELAKESDPISYLANSLKKKTKVTLG